jgi:hypothetical protein
MADEMADTTEGKRHSASFLPPAPHSFRRALRCHLMER